MSPDLHHLSGAYAVDALDDTERASFEQHLAVCAACRAEVAELSAAAHSLASVTESTPPPSLRASVLSGITQVRPLPPLTEGALTEDAGGTVVPIRRPPRTVWLAAAAAAAVITVGGLAWSPWSNDDTLSPMATVAAAADATRVTGSEGSLTAAVAYSRQLGRAAIDVSGLPPAPDGKTYQLWYVGSDQVARSAGLMTADATGHGSMLLEGDVNAASAVAITMEPAGGSTRPTSDPMVVLPLA